jgi:hypothetical protein
VFRQPVDPRSQPGNTVTYRGTVDVQADGFTNNDTDEENRTAK